MLIDLIQEVKEKGYKLKICPSVETNLSPLTVILSSPDPLTAAMIHFLQSMKEPGKGPVNPKVLFNQLCQKYGLTLYIRIFWFSLLTITILTTHLFFSHNV
ncbi:Ubiquitin carboxyl-terminal hydrolase 45 [Goodea atripinnis]|uniref:Ubiquitin carboxyl-terminal hydrolase 45 n=1 Tax=Goodea atripinnis TaxID=208336 RepID=A0ABV0NDU2_9TELE